MIDAKNKVPEYQRLYQQKYAQHMRLWKIVRHLRLYILFSLPLKAPKGHEKPRASVTSGCHSLYAMMIRNDRGIGHVCWLIQKLQK